MADIEKPAEPSATPDSRIFHYTIVENYNNIVRDRLIIPATERVPPGERPAVWFSIHPVWERTATKALKDRRTGKIHRATWKEMQSFGLVRIEIAPATAPYGWDDYLRLSGVTPATARELRRSANRWGADALHWRLSFEAVSAEKWLAVELWSGTAWNPIQQSEDTLPSGLLADARFAFIATTVEDWARFKQADVIAGRDAKTQEVSVVFGHELIRRAKDRGEAGVPALVVPFNPDTDELMRLAAACTVLKGRNDLYPRG